MPNICGGEKNQFLKHYTVKTAKNYINVTRTSSDIGRFFLEPR